MENEKWENDRAAILTALDDPCNGNPIAQAVADKIAEYRVMFTDQTADGHPEKFVFPAPSSELERLALSLFIDAVKEETGAEIHVRQK